MNLEPYRVIMIFHPVCIRVASGLPLQSSMAKPLSVGSHLAKLVCNPFGSFSKLSLHNVSHGVLCPASGGHIRLPLQSLCANQVPRASPF